MIRYQYVTVPRRRNPVVVAFTASSSATGVITISLGASFCSKRDKFDRRIGRSIAEGRASKKPFQTFVEMAEGESFNTVVSREIEKYVTKNHAMINSFYTLTSRKPAASIVNEKSANYIEVPFFGI